MELLGIIGVGVVALVGAVIGIYNSLIRLRANVDEGWSGIDVQLKRRYDLIPNLVETVKGYAKHEKETLTAVMEARSKATAMNIDISKVTPDMMAQFSKMQSGISGALGKLFAVAEAYPDLKANENFIKLQEELSIIEDAIQSSRRYFNGTVRDYNVRVETVPSNIIAGMFGFAKREFFKIDEAEKENVKVEF